MTGRRARPSIAEVRATLVSAYGSWRSHRTIRLGAGLAYYGLFSLSSVIAITIGLLRVVGRSAAMEEAVALRVEELAGPAGVASVTEFFEVINEALWITSDNQPRPLFGT